MGKEFAVIESMTTDHVHLDDFDMWTIRVWRDEQTVQDKYDNSDIHRTVSAEIGKRHWSIAEFARRIANLDRVNAVEVKDERGQGVVCYPSWP